MNYLNIEIVSVNIVATNVDHVSITVNKDLHGEFQQWNENTLKINTPSGGGIRLVRLLGWGGPITTITPENDPVMTTSPALPGFSS